MGGKTNIDPLHFFICLFMRSTFFAIVVTLLCCVVSPPRTIFAQSTFTASQQEIRKELSHILASKKSGYSFSGMVLIKQAEQTLYEFHGSGDNHTTPTMFTDTSQFVIGSISKQCTGVLVLREMEQGRLNLFAPIRTYLPELTQSWADTVNAHHLLTHTHGITKLSAPTLFPPGTQFSYSQIGYELLARIVAKTSGKSFAECVHDLFRLCGMRHSFHPAVKQYTQLVQGYTGDSTGAFIAETSSLENYPAAGALISTAQDLVRWNEALYSGKLLSSGTMHLLTTTKPNAIRQHPLFGKTEYSYGITIDNRDSVLQLGNTGFAPGFASMNFYFPATRISIVILSNVDCCSYRNDLASVFAYHTAIQQAVRAYQLRMNQRK